MQRIRIRYAKVDRVRYVSARDLTSVWERALRRADLPIAYSEGFSPHPKVSFPDALPVGYASTGEYAELTFAVPIKPERDLAALSATLPTGMDITSYWEVPAGAPKLARMLRATLWELSWMPDQVSTDQLVPPLERLMASGTAEVIRRRKEKDVTFDVRPPLRTARVSVMTDVTHHAQHDARISRARIILRAVLDNDGPAVRPTDIFAALQGFADDELPAPRLHTRIAQGDLVEGGLKEALGNEVFALEPDLTTEAA